MPLRVVADAPASAAWNMAVDSALLATPQPPVLRFYTFDPAAVSLGYFQRVDDFADLPPDTAIVRRPTGGGAIHHQFELTFALVADAKNLPRDVAASYCELHTAIARALAAIGVSAHVQDDGGEPSARPSDRWCFAQPVRHDLVTERGKLCGSAQRRSRAERERVLHHGSLVLQRPQLTPFVGAIADQVPVDDAVVASLRRHIATEIGRALRLEPQSAHLDDTVVQLAERLRKRFEAPAYLRRR